MSPDSVKKLEIWRESVLLVKKIYDLTGEWPPRELYGLTAQVRRAAVSIPSNIAEGIGRGTPTEAAHFAQISLGSIYELCTLLEISGNLGFTRPGQLAEIGCTLHTLARRTSTFIRYKRSRVPRA